ARVGELLGVNLAADLSGAETAEEFISWVEKTDELASAQAVHRLRLTLDLAALFGSRNATTLLRAWLREIDPALDRRSPAAVIRDPGSGPARPALRRAAQRFPEDRAPSPRGAA